MAQRCGNRNQIESQRCPHKGLAIVAVLLLLVLTGCSGTTTRSGDASTVDSAAAPEDDLPPTPSADGADEPSTVAVAATPAATSTPNTPADADTELTTALKFLDDGFDAADATALDQLVNVRTMSAVELTDGWLAISDDLSGRPSLLVSDDGLSWASGDSLSGLPERTQGPYRLWALGDEILLYAHVANPQNSSLTAGIVARSQDGRTWTDLELADLVSDDGGAVFSADGLSAGFVGRVQGDFSESETIHVVTADTEAVTSVEVDQFLVNLTANEERVLALLDPAVYAAPLLGQIDLESGQITSRFDSQGFNPLITNNVGATQLAFNEDRLFASFNVGATWTEYVYPGSSRAGGRFGRFGAVSDRIGVGDSRAFGISSDGIIWHEIPVPPNTVDVTLSGMNPSGALMYFRLNGLSASVLVLVPWPDSLADLDEAAAQAATEPPNRFAIGRAAAPLLVGFAAPEELLACVKDTARLDTSNEIIAAALACDAELITALKSEVFAALDDGSLPASTDQSCVRGAIDQFSEQWVIDAARNARTSTELRLEAGQLMTVQCGPVPAVEPSSELGKLFGALRPSPEFAELPTFWPVRSGQLNYWRLPTNDFSVRLATTPGTNELVEATLKLHAPTGFRPLDDVEANLFDVLLDGFGLGLQNGISANAVLRSGAFTFGDTTICSSVDNDVMVIRIGRTVDTC